MPSMTNKLSFAAALAAVGLCAAGCPEANQQSCPAGSTTVGGFTLKFAPVSSTDACLVVLAADGGALDGSISTTPADTSATLCATTDDGGSVILLVPNQLSRKSAVNDAGGFSFASVAPGISGT